jgi:hypothetical protein
VRDTHAFAESRAKVEERIAPVLDAAALKPPSVSKSGRQQL